MEHKIFIFTFMMGFLPWIINDKVQKMALWVNGALSMPLEVKSLIEWPSTSRVLPIWPFFWLLINILIYEKQVIDFKRHVSTEPCSHLLY